MVVVPLDQAGVDKARRFSFYDQVHTTGMDIKQGLDAKAALTLGKDMTFRDYAQVTSVMHVVWRVLPGCLAAWLTDKRAGWLAGAQSGLGASFLPPPSLPPSSS